MRYPWRQEWEIIEDQTNNGENGDEMLINI